MTNGQELRPRVRIPVLGMLSGFFGALGVLVLLQQYEVAYPTRTMTIAFLVGGVVLNLVVANVAAALTDRRPTAESAGNEATAVLVPATMDGGSWMPTHVVPHGGLPMWTTPDPSAAPVGRLDPGLDVVVDGREGNWAHVVCSNRWTAWVDGRLLQELVR